MNVELVIINYKWELATGGRVYATYKCYLLTFNLYLYRLLSYIARKVSIFDATQNVSDEWCKMLLVPLGLCYPSVKHCSYNPHQL